MDDPVDRDVLAGDRGGDRIDEEGHVVVDHRDAHAAARVVGRERFQRDRRFARPARGGGGGDEAGGGVDLRGAELAQFSRKRPDRQTGGERGDDVLLHARALRPGSGRLNPATTPSTAA